MKSENIKGSGSDILHVRNQVTLNDEKLVCLSSHMWIQFVRCRLPQIYILYLGVIITSIVIGGGGKNTGVNTMYGNTLPWVTHKVCVSHCQLLLQLTTSTMASLKHM